MAKNFIGSRPFWLRIAAIGSVIWVGATYLCSLVRPDAFQFWSDYYRDEPGPALWFALVGVILIAIISASIPWIVAAQYQRPFWTRIATVSAATWVGATVLYSQVHPHWLYAYDSDNVLIFGLVGALLILATFSSVPWIIKGASQQKVSGVPPSGVAVSSGATAIGAQANGRAQQKSGGVAVQIIAFIVASAVVRSCFMMQQPHPPYTGPNAASQPPQFPITPIMNGTLVPSGTSVLQGATAQPTKPQGVPDRDASSIKPSFDCAHVTKWAATQVCASPTLAAADSRMALLYSQLTAALSDVAKVSLRNEQREWIKTRDGCEFSIDPSACLTEAYYSRASELNALALAMPAQTSLASTSPPVGTATTPPPAEDAQEHPAQQPIQSEQPSNPATQSNTPTSHADCTSEDRRIAELAEKNGYQYQSKCQ